MKKLLLIVIAFFLSFHSYTQTIQFQRVNKATVSENGIDTLLYPFTGGLSNPQFSNIDLDGDNVQDLFVFERSGGRVLCFLRKNNKWVHAPQFEAQFPPLYQWVKLKDYNCDGKPDIFTELDPNGPVDSRNYDRSNGLRVIKNITTEPGKLKWFQLSDKVFTTPSGELPEEKLGLAFRDLSEFEDMDNDGDLDLITMIDNTNIFMYYQNQSKELNYGCDSILFKFRDQCWGYISFLVNKNGFLLNDSSPCFRDYKRGFKHNGSTITAFDYDKDGDMDLLYGDLSYNDVTFLTNGKTLNSLGRDSIIRQDTLFPLTGRRASVQVFPATYLVDINNDGKKDLIVAPNSTEGAMNKDMVLSYINTSPTAYQFTFQQDDFLIGDMLDLGGGSKPQLVDLDKDDDLDLVIATHENFIYTSNSDDRLHYYENIGNKTKANFVLRDTNFLKINAGPTKIYEISPSFGDLNNDGKPDLIIGDINGVIHYYLNISTENKIDFSKVSSNYFNIYAGTFATPQLVDLNQDTKLDLLLGRRNGTLAYFENKGTIDSAVFWSEPSIDSIGGINVSEFYKGVGGQPDYYFPGYSHPHVCDIDKDGRFEILVGSIGSTSGGKVQLFSNFEASATRKCEEITKLYLSYEGSQPRDLFFGKFSTPFCGDLDNDGKPELLIGSNKGGLESFTPIIKGIISGNATLTKDELEFVVFPNPSKGSFNLRFNKNLKAANYSIYSITGSKLLEGQITGYESTLETNLSSGFYLLYIETKQGDFMSKKISIE